MELREELTRLTEKAENIPEEEQRFTSIFYNKLMTKIAKTEELIAVNNDMLAYVLGVQ
jgi:hypothetical protein